MEWHFAIKSGRPIKMALVIINFVTEFPNKGKEPVCQKWNGEFRSEYSDRNMRATSGGNPEYSGQKKPKWAFPIEFRPILERSLANFYYYMALSHKDWELPNSRIWLAEMDIDPSLYFPI